MKNFIDNIRSKPAGGIILLFVSIQIVAIIGGLMFADSFRYLNPANIAVLLKSMAPLGIMAIGVGILMITGEFDLILMFTRYSACPLNIPRSFGASVKENLPLGSSQPLSIHNLPFFILLSSGINGSLDPW